MEIKREYTEPEYRALSSISYSALSSLDSYPASIINTTPMEMTDPLIYGSAVDCLAFDGREVFEEKFTTMNAIKPNWTGIKLFNAIYSEIQATLDILDELSNDLNDYGQVVLKVARIENYGGDNWKDETVINKLVKSYSSYFKALVDSQGKLILDAQQYEYVENSVNVLFTHDFTADSFTPKEGQDVYYQLPIVWDYKDDKLNKTIHCKSLLDIMLVDHNTKTIHPIDLKTTGKSVFVFDKSFIEWKYYLQAAFYTEAVRHLCSVQYPELADYKIELFKFVVISSKNPRKPLAFQITEEVLAAGKYGGKLKDNGKPIKGYIDLVRDYNWHVDHQLFDYPREIYEKKGLVVLDNIEY